MSDEKTSYSIPVIISMLLHTLIIGVMTVSWVGGFNIASKSEPQADKKKPEPKIVQAKAITDIEVEREIKRLERIDQRKERERQRLIKQAELAKQKRLQEQQRLNKLKQEQERARALALRKQQAEKRKAEEALSKLAKSLKDKQKKLEEVKKQQQVAEQKRLEKEQARKREEAKIAEIKKQQAIAQEKKKEEARLKKQALERQRQQEHARRERDRKVTQQVERFGLMVQEKVTRNWLVQGTRTEGALCVLKVRLGAGGIVLDVELVHSSGDSALDRSAIAAVYKSSPLPVPENPAAFEKMRELRLTLKPQDIMSAG